MSVFGSCRFRRLDLRTSANSPIGVSLTLRRDSRLKVGRERGRGLREIVSLHSNSTPTRQPGRCSFAWERRAYRRSLVLTDSGTPPYGKSRSTGAGRSKGDLSPEGCFLLDMQVKCASSAIDFSPPPRLTTSNDGNLTGKHSTSSRGKEVLAETPSPPLPRGSTF